MEQITADSFENFGTEAAPEENRDSYSEYIDTLIQKFGNMSDVEKQNLFIDSTTRFSDVLPSNQILGTSIALIGAGGIGNWVWRVLLGMGFTNISVFDPDTVDTVNIGPQTHNVVDLNLPKVEAVRRAALQMRGVELRVFQTKVESHSDVHRELGYLPTIIIGATDSAEFRKKFYYGIHCASAPELYIDLRMSLGDWICYAIQKNDIPDGYRQEAIFDEDDALHEPCTARAITYTGANIASYVGALIHYWLTHGKTLNEASNVFSWRYSFSSRDFRPVDREAAEAEAFRRSHLLRAVSVSLASKYCPDMDYRLCEGSAFPDVDSRNEMLETGRLAYAVNLLTGQEFLVDHKNSSITVNGGERDTANEMLVAWAPLPGMSSMLQVSHPELAAFDVDPDGVQPALLWEPDGTITAFFLEKQMDDHVFVIKGSTTGLTVREWLNFRKQYCRLNEGDCSLEGTVFLYDEVVRRLKEQTTDFITLGDMKIYTSEEKYLAHEGSDPEKVDDLPIGTRLLINGETYEIERRAGGLVYAKRDGDDNSGMRVGISIRASLCGFDEEKAAYIL